MVTNSQSRWFSRGNIHNLKSCICPRCGASYTVGPIFDHDMQTCLNCGASLAEWNMNFNIYLIDVEKAPLIVKKIIEYLAPLDEHNAFHQLLELLRFLGVEKE
jgi:hypothetical protein